MSEPAYRLPELTDEELAQLRARGAACWSCKRLLAAGSYCPEHGPKPVDSERKEGR